MAMIVPERQVGPQAVTGQKLSIVDPTQALTEGAKNIQRVAETAAPIIKKVGEQRDLDAVLRAQAVFDKRLLDEGLEYQKRRGVQTKGLTRESADYYDGASNELLDTLENDRQKQAFQEHILKGRSKWVSKYGNYEITETRTALDAGSKARIKTAVDMAAANHVDPSEHITDIKRTVRATAMAMGDDQDMADARMSEALTLAHKAVIEARVGAEDLEGAKQYLSENKNEIGGTERAQLKDYIDEADLVTRARDRSMEIMRSAESESDALKRADKISNAKLAKETKANIRQAYADKEEAQRQSQKAASDQAYSLFTDQGVRYDQLVTQYPNIHKNLSGETKLALQRLSRGGHPEISDTPTKYKLIRMSTQEPKKFKDLNLLDHVADLSLSDFDSLARAQADMSKPGKDGDDAFKSHRTDRDIAEQAMAAAGINPKNLENPTGSNGQDARAFDERIEWEWQQAAIAKDRKLTSAEKREIAQNLALEVIMDPDAWWQKGGRPAFEADIPGVPQRHIDDYAGVLNQFGAEISDANIQMMAEVGTPSEIQAIIDELGDMPDLSWDKLSEAMRIYIELKYSN